MSCDAFYRVRLWGLSGRAKTEPVMLPSQADRVMATHGLLWMDARSEMRDNALFYLKKLWGFLDMPERTSNW